MINEKVLNVILFFDYGIKINNKDNHESKFVLESLYYRSKIEDSKLPSTNLDPYKFGLTDDGPYNIRLV